MVKSVKILPPHHLNVKALSLLQYAIFSIGLSAALTSAALAQQPLPGPADAGRIKPEEKIPAPDHNEDHNITVPHEAPAVPIPEAAKNIHFTLKSVRIDGVTAFTSEQLGSIYAPYIGKEISLDIAYVMANTITERYRRAGYFLSLAYVPDQSIKDGAITLRVVEGYVGKVELPEKIGDHRVVRGYIDRLTARKPVKSAQVERFLLQINDLPGYSFRAVLSPLEKGVEGEMKLTLVPTKKSGKGSIGFDNYSSRYLGPNEISASYSTSLLPLQQTSISALSSVPANKLGYGTFDHLMAIAPDMTLELNGGATKAYPGYRLQPFEISSLATSESLSLNYQWVRQRQENLALKFMLDSRDITSDILHTPLTRDHIRALRIGTTYDMSDSWHGYNIATATISRGISGLGASQKNDINLSRAGAIPDFYQRRNYLCRGCRASRTTGRCLLRPLPSDHPVYYILPNSSVMAGRRSAAPMMHRILPEIRVWRAPWNCVTAVGEICTRSSCNLTPFMILVRYGMKAPANPGTHPAHRQD